MSRVVQRLSIVAVVLLLVACGGPAGSPQRPSSPDPERQRLVSDLLSKIPTGASISIQPELVAYLGSQGSPYLFPVVADSEYVLTDVAASQDPFVVKGIYQKVRELLETGEFGVVEAKDGVALLRRGLEGQDQLPGGFYDFLRARTNREAFPIRARFGEALELVAYDYQMSGEQLATMTTYWRALRPLAGNYGMVFFLSPVVGQQPEAYEYSGPSALWYPPNRWQSGEVIRAEFSPAQVSRGARSVQVTVYRQTETGNRIALSPVVPGRSAAEGALTVLDLKDPPKSKVSLQAFIGLPFETVTAPPGNPVSSQAQSPVPAPAGLSLCGKPLEDAGLASLRPVAVKIDNAPGARPQVGMEEACVVYEHMAEGGITRFTAIYHTEETEVGPVRSARRVDLHIVPQYQAFFAHVGGAPAEMALIRKYRLLDVDQFFNAGAYYYIRQRPAPHNVFTTVSRIRSKAEALGYGGEAHLEGFPLSEQKPEGGLPATQILLPFRSPSQGEFRYDPGEGDYVRFTGGRPHVEAGSGRSVRATTVIVQRVPVSIASYTEDVNGAPSLDFDLVGEGPAVVFRDGEAFEGEWVRPSLDGWTQFYDESGRIIPLAPGKIWISLLSLDEEVTFR